MNNALESRRLVQAGAGHIVNGLLSFRTEQEVK